MRIAINASFHLMAGGALHVRRLLNAWCADGVDAIHEITVFTRPEGIASLQIPKNGRIRVYALQLGDTYRKLLWEQVRLPALVSDGGFDVLFCPGNIVPFGGSLPSVVVFQNIAPFSNGVTLRRTGAYTYAWFRLLSQFMRVSARLATRVIFVSHFFRVLFEKRYGHPPEKSDVIYHGRDSLVLNRPDSEVLQELGLQRPYILSVGHLQPYKNFPELIHGYSLARKVMQRRGLRLAIVGKPGIPSYLCRLRRLISKLELDDWVLITGEVPHERIGSLLAGCEFSVFQSTCEACPNGLIEVLSAGVPVMSSSAGAMPEIAGKAALYFDPYSPEDISGALIRMAEDSSLRAQLRAGGLQQVLKFPTWSEVGQLTLRSLERAADARRRSV